MAAAALLRLYEAAARAAAPRGGSGSSSYVRLWLGLARRTWGRRGADEGRDVFKTVRASTRGGACAYVWSEWAGLEAAADGGGGAAKAAALLAKGRAAGAGPTDVLDAAAAAVAARAWPPARVAPWHTADAAPLPGARRPPARPPAATPSGRVTAGVSAAAAEAPTPTVTVGGGGVSSSTVKPPRRIGGGATTPAAPPPLPPNLSSLPAAKRKAAADAGAPSPAAAAAAKPPKRRSTPDADDAGATTLAAPPLGRGGRPSAAPTVMKGGASARALVGADGDATTRPLRGGRREAAAAPEPPAPAPPPPPPPQQRRPREDDASILVRGTRYAKLECVGRGGSSKVYKVMAPSRKIYALKRIRLTGRDAEAAQGFVDEIGLLTALKGKPGIVELIDAEVVPSEKLILVVLEYGDIDLARLLAKQQAGAAAAAKRVGGAAAAPPPPDGVFIRLYWRQMLDAVATIHAARIVHSDLKPANFLVVQGCLKLIDFGIAKAIGADTTSIARESQVGWCGVGRRVFRLPFLHAHTTPSLPFPFPHPQVGTLNYMSPEAVLGGATPPPGTAAASSTSTSAPVKVGRPSDVWSLGCILYQMAYGATPFAHLPFLAKLHAITDPHHAIDFPPLADRALADCIRACLTRDARARATIDELRTHPFLTGEVAAPAPSGDGDAVALTREQLATLLAQAAAAGAAGGTAAADAAAAADIVFERLRGPAGTGDAGGTRSGVSAPAASAVSVAARAAAAVVAPAQPPPAADPTSERQLRSDLAAMRFESAASSVAASSVADDDDVSS